MMGQLKGPTQGQSFTIGDAISQNSLFLQERGYSTYRNTLLSDKSNSIISLDSNGSQSSRFYGFKCIF
jgi:hypothetical protein